MGPGADSNFQLWDLESKRQSYQWSLDRWHSVRCASFSPDGRYLLLGSGEQLELLDVSTGRTASQIESELGIRTCAITPDWRVLVSASGRYLQIWQRK